MEEEIIYSNPWPTAYQYTGQELDSETGLYYHGARYYDPKISRFMSVDPLADKMPAFSPYCYTFNNPIKYNDPTGMVPSTTGDPTDPPTDMNETIQGVVQSALDGIYSIYQSIKEVVVQETESPHIGTGKIMYSSNGHGGETKTSDSIDGFVDVEGFGGGGVSSKFSTKHAERVVDVIDKISRASAKMVNAVEISDGETLPMSVPRSTYSTDEIYMISQELLELQGTNDSLLWGTDTIRNGRIEVTKTLNTDPNFNHDFSIQVIEIK